MMISVEKPCVEAISASGNDFKKINFLRFPKKIKFSQSGSKSPKTIQNNNISILMARKPVFSSIDIYMTWNLPPGVMLQKKISSGFFLKMSGFFFKISREIKTTSFSDIAPKPDVL